MAASSKVAQNGDRCPECGGGFAKDRACQGFRRHLSRRAKFVADADGNPIMCGGTRQSWGKGGKD